MGANMDHQEALIQDLTNKCAFDIAKTVTRNMSIMNAEPELDQNTISCIAAAAMVKALVTFSEHNNWRKGLLEEAIDVYTTQRKIKLQR